jgi:hypothetical protein
MSEKQRSRFTTHLFRIGAYIAAFFWLAFVYVAWRLASRPESERHSHLIGWTILVIATTVMIATINHWVKYLQAILGGFVLGGLLATMSGHLLNDAKPFPRLIAASMTALFVGCSLISRTLARHRLTVFDRVALITFLVAFVGGIVRDTPTSGLIGLGIGFGCLLAAWVRDRFSSVPRRESGETAPDL